MRDEPILFDDARTRVLDAIGDIALPEGAPDIYLVRDLFGKIGISVSKDAHSNEAMRTLLKRLACTLQDRLGPRGRPEDRAVLWLEDELLEELRETRHRVSSGFYWVDRLLVGEEWWTIRGDGDGTVPARYVLYSIKGGVGRSTTAAVLAWHLAQRGEDVLVVDLDIESPGLGATMLDRKAQPKLGIVDWFVEELVGQGDDVLDDMIATPAWAHEMQGDVRVAPAHGREAGDYLSKLGRAYMDTREDPWRVRLGRLLDRLENTLTPTIVLIESRSGVHDIAAATVTDLDAEVLLFAVDSQSTWTGYDLLFDHWETHGLAPRIRDRLSIVSALTPGPDNPGYPQRFRENAWNLFRDRLYDPVTGTGEISESVSYDLDSDGAPHDPFVIHWNRGLAGGASLRNLGRAALAPVHQAYAPFLDRFDRLDLGRRTQRENPGDVEGVGELRSAVGALPKGTSHGGELTPGAVYLPPSHRKALHPNTMLVTGMRGSGKTFWWSALQNAEIRSLMTQLDGKFHLDANTKVRTGFGEADAPNDYPGPDELQSIAKDGVAPRLIWRTIHARHLSAISDPLQRLNSWSERVRYVKENPGPVAKLLYDRDIALDQKGRFHLVLFDALDLCTNRWEDMLSFIRGLLGHARDVRSYRRLRVKAFLRSDQVVEEKVADFADASKVLSSAVELTWPRRDLYGLLWHNLANGPYGDQVRSRLQRGSWPSRAIAETQVYPVPRSLATDESVQRDQFHVITGPWMGAGPKRGFPYTWIPNHLGDAQGKVSPRSFLAALRAAAEDTTARHPDHTHALHFESVKRGVQEASKIRVRELREDYPWVDRVLGPLAGSVVPCKFAEIERVWQEEEVLAKLRQEVGQDQMKLPPRRIEQGEAGVREDLEELKLFRRLKDGRVDIPDVFRVGYGLGRKGGVKPVK